MRHGDSYALPFFQPAFGYLETGVIALAIGRPEEPVEWCRSIQQPGWIADIKPPRLNDVEDYQTAENDSHKRCDQSDVFLIHAAFPQHVIATSEATTLVHVRMTAMGRFANFRFRGETQRSCQARVWQLFTREVNRPALPVGPHRIATTLALTVSAIAFQL